MTDFSNILRKIRRAIHTVKYINEPLKTTILERLLIKIIMEDERKTEIKQLQENSDVKKFEANYLG